MRAIENLHWSDITRTLLFQILKPLLYHSYQIRWELPKEGKEKLISSQLVWKAEAIQNSLLQLRPDEKQIPKINQDLQKALTDLLGQLGNALGEKRKDLECGLMVFDQRLNKLRLVAGSMRSEYYKDWSLYEGQGIAGRTHKTNKAHIFVRAKTPMNEDYYTSTPSLAPIHEAVFAIPLRFPIDRPDIPEADRMVIGVFSVGSYSPTSGLARLFDLDDADTSKLGGVLINSIHGMLLPVLEHLSL